VAYRTALEAKGAAAKRRAKPRREAIDPDPWRGLQPLLDQELTRLPDKYRVPIVLCDLEGKTRKEAARQLGWPEGTLSGHLSRGRVLLAKRLARRGLALSGGAVAVALSKNAATAQVPVALLLGTFKAATSVGAGSAAAAGAISAPVAALTEGVLRAMLLAKLKYVTAAFLALALVGLSLGTAVYRTPAAEPRQATKAATAQSVAFSEPTLPAVGPAPSRDPAPNQKTPADPTAAPKEVAKDPAPKAPADDTKPAEKLDLPTGPAPIPVLASMDKQRRIAITMVFMVPKRLEDWTGYQKVPDKVTKAFKAEEIQAYDSAGKKIDAKDLPKMLQKEVLALGSANGKEVDPISLRLVKEGTLIFVFPPFQPEHVARPLEDLLLDPKKRLPRVPDGIPAGTLPVIPPARGEPTVPRDF
jgi:hypothetical protein